MQLSVIIVSYNVEAFLAQCLVSVERAITHYSEVSGKNDVIEVCVVDNISVDGTTEMVKTKFPWVKLIENTENVGFSIANNQAIKISEAKYILLLNPDTVVQEEDHK
jgi:GT2 family glycosyltransferase